MFFLKGMGIFTHALFLFAILFFSAAHAGERKELWQRLLSDVSASQLVVDNEEEFRRLLKSENGASIACNFPARAYLAIADKSQLKQAFATCSDLNEFRRKVPFHKLSLVFAAEDISSPASNMGHVFLQVSGQGGDGTHQSYGVSFITSISGNPVSLSYSLLFGGREGFVALGPASQEIAKYVDLSKRTVWISSIDTAQLDLEFMQLYLWELRQNAPKYFFIKFNCATFLEHLLSVSSDAPNKKHWSFQTPRELFNNYAGQQGAELQIYPSVDWFLDALKHHGEKEYASWLHSVDAGFEHDKNSQMNTASLLFASNYTEKLRRQKKLVDGKALKRLNYFQRELDARGVEKDKFFADNVARPSNFFPPNKLAFGLSNQGGEKSHIFSYRPAAVDIYTFQPLSFGVQENVLASSQWSISEGASSVRLERADVFSMSSLRSWSKINPAYSFRTRLGFDRLLDGQTQTTLTYKGGISKRLLNDVLVYGLVGAGIGKHQTKASNGIALAEFGVKVNLLADFSLMATRSNSFWGFERERKETQDSVTVQRRLSRGYSLDFSYQSSKNKLNHSLTPERFNLSLASYF
jgi:hypothetical protein